MKKILRFITQRVVITALLIVLQALLLFGFIWKLDNYFVYFYAGSVLLSLLITLGIINSKSNPAYKIAWLIPILLFPVFGGLVYLLFGSDRTGRYLRKKLQGIGTEMDNVIGEAHRRSGAEQLPPDAANQSRYISHCAYCPPYQNTTTEYLPLGEVKFERMVEELKKAKHYIFLEYFIIQEGKMWNTILDILRQKAAEGVDVRVIYDDMGCIMILPTGYDRTLEQMGIKCRIFNPFVPILSSRFNTRDHRKICVIDGNVGFTGGINLADEYINAYEKHGHWKDTSILLKGEAVFNLTVMFLSMWDYLDGTIGKTDYSRYYPTVWDENAKGYVQPFADNPLDDEAVGETVYLNLINKAKRYVYITTPYLILSSEMLTALTSAAKCGVDVRIITPHIRTSGMSTRCPVPTISRSSKRGLKSTNTPPASSTPRPLWWTTTTRWWAPSIWTTAACICILSAPFGCTRPPAWRRCGTTFSKPSRSARRSRWRSAGASPSRADWAARCCGCSHR